MYANGIIFDWKLLGTATIPIKGSVPSRDELEILRTVSISIKSALASMELAPYAMDPNSYLRFIEPMLNWNTKARWTNNYSDSWEPDKPLCQQVFDSTRILKFQKKI